MSTRRVKDVMTTDIVSVSIDTPVIEAVRLMNSREIGSILICREQDLVGIFTERDILRVIHRDIDRLHQPIGDNITQMPKTVAADSECVEAYRMMKRHYIRHLPVIENKRLVGIISIHDLIGILNPVEQDDPEQAENLPADNKKGETVVDLSPYQMRNVEILAHLLMHNAVTPEITEKLRLSEMDYFSVIDKSHYLEKRANIDEKTNLLKYKRDYLCNIVKTASRVFQKEINRYCISLARFDIDDFSHFNNQYGHAVGDRALTLFSDFLKNNIRPTDYAIRFGGEEFDILLPGTDQESARKVLEKIYDRIDELRFEHEGNTLRITVSCGLSCSCFDLNHRRPLDQDAINSDYENLQAEADNALYEAKHLGKARYAVYDKNKREDYLHIRKQYVKK